MNGLCRHYANTCYVIDGHEHLWFAQGHDSQLDEVVFEALQTLREAPKQTRKAPTHLSDIRPLIHEMRLFKSDVEADIMRRAGKISAAAHTRAMQHVSPGCFEYQQKGYQFN